MLTAYDAFAFCKQPLNLESSLIRHILAAIRYDDYHIYSFSVSSMATENNRMFKGDIVQISSQES